jgi:hypothetical protein
MFRFVCASVLVGLILAAAVSGCSEQNKETKVPDKEIPLPKEGPMPAGAGGKAVQPAAGGGAPAETAQ